MGILTYETFFLDVLIKKKLRTRKDDFKFPRGHMNFFSVFSGVIDPAETISAGTLTPRKFLINFFSWPRGNRFRRVIDPAETVSQGSLTRRKSYMKIFSRFCGVNDPRKTFSAGSLTPLKWFPRGHWPRWNSIKIDFLSEYEAICKTALGRESGP
jgi:hypothetical protein